MLPPHPHHSHNVNNPSSEITCPTLSPGLWRDATTAHPSEALSSSSLMAMVCPVMPTVECNSLVGLTALHIISIQNAHFLHPLYFSLYHLPEQLRHFHSVNLGQFSSDFALFPWGLCQDVKSQALKKCPNSKLLTYQFLYSVSMRKHAPSPITVVSIWFLLVGTG